MLYTSPNHYSSTCFCHPHLFPSPNPELWHHPEVKCIQVRYWFSGWKGSFIFGQSISHWMLCLFKFPSNMVFNRKVFWVSCWASPPPFLNKTVKLKVVLSMVKSDGEHLTIVPSHPPQSFSSLSLVQFLSSYFSDTCRPGMHGKAWPLESLAL